MILKPASSFGGVGFVSRWQACSVGCATSCRFVLDLADKQYIYARETLAEFVRESQRAHGELRVVLTSIARVSRSEYEPVLQVPQILSPPSFKAGGQGVVPLHMRLCTLLRRKNHESFSLRNPGLTE